MNYIKCGKEEGAKCVLGGKRWGEKGYYIGKYFIYIFNQNIKKLIFYLFQFHNLLFIIMKEII